MGFFLAIASGILGGAIGVVPFLVARLQTRNAKGNDGAGGIARGMAATLVSFLALFALIALCRLVAEDYFLPFSLSVIGSFLLSMVVFVTMLMRR